MRLDVLNEIEIFVRGGEIGVVSKAAIAKIMGCDPRTVKKYMEGYVPKKRIVISQNMQDKIINHLVTRQILYPAILPCLINENVASRENMGTKKGLEYYYQYIRNCRSQFEKFYILKCDISKYFASIDHTILKQKLRRKIKDNFLLFHESKKYLQECLSKIREFLKNEKLELNRKTRIYSNKENFVFLGRKKNKNYANYRRIKSKLNKRFFLFENEFISLNSLLASINSFNSLDRKYTEEYLNKLCLRKNYCKKEIISIK